MLTVSCVFCMGMMFPSFRCSAFFPCMCNVVCQLPLCKSCIAPNAGVTSLHIQGDLMVSGGNDGLCKVWSFPSGVWTGVKYDGHGSYSGPCPPLSAPGLCTPSALVAFLLPVISLPWPLLVSLLTCPVPRRDSCEVCSRRFWQSCFNLHLLFKFVPVQCPDLECIYRATDPRHTGLEQSKFEPDFCLVKHEEVPCTILPFAQPFCKAHLTHHCDVL